MAEKITWEDIYMDKCMENKDLEQEIRVLQTILRSYLPVVSMKDNSENNRNNK